MTEPRVLSSLLSFLPWTDFLSLSQTCSKMRKITESPKIRDVVLSRYVEGYGSCLKMQQGERDTSQDLPVTLHDIDLLRKLSLNHLALHVLIVDQ